ncbi:MAG TPA: choice-of-anchor Q domain-containing protein, partial [Chryseolinea sp.]|nr:choice-of-anchor Q domain-containing protein [Chryseolinea sp.]
FLFMGTEILSARIENTILWDNTATVAGPEIFTTGIHLNSYSLLEGSGGSSAWVASYGTDDGNNIDSNPGFTNAASPKGIDNIPANDDDGLHLGASSPAVNHGNNGAAGLAGIALDYSGDSRVLGSSVDIGAYERAGIIIPDFPLFWLYDWRPIRPGCLSCPWSVLLLDRVIQNFAWDGRAQLIDQGDAAVITGHIVNIDNNKIGFNVYLKLEKKQNWKTWSAQGGTYVAFTLDALKVAKVKHTLWTFWQLSPESYLEGTGDVSGKLLLKTIPSIVKTGFQLGEGGNGWDRDFGLAGSFAYSGKLVVRGKRQSLVGVGSINVDAVLCNKDCTPLIETSRSLVEVPEEKSSDNTFSVYPIPARTQLTISTTSLPSGKYTVKFYNDKGLLKMQETLDTDNGDFNLSLQDVEPGLYVLTIISPTGDVRSRKLTVE